MVKVGLLIAGLSIIIMTYGFFLRRRSSNTEVWQEVGRRVMRGDHLGENHLKPAYDVASLMVLRESRSKKCIVGSVIGLVVGGVMLVIDILG